MIYIILFFLIISFEPFCLRVLFLCFLFLFLFLFLAVSLSNNAAAEHVHVDILSFVSMGHVVKDARLVDVDGGATVGCVQAVSSVVVHGRSFSH